MLHIRAIARLYGDHGYEMIRELNCNPVATVCALCECVCLYMYGVSVMYVCMCVCVYMCVCLCVCVCVCLNNYLMISL